MKLSTIIAGALSLFFHAILFFIDLPASKVLPEREKPVQIRLQWPTRATAPPRGPEQSAQALSPLKPERKVRKVKKEKKREEVKEEPSPQPVEPLPLLEENKKRVNEESPAMAETSPLIEAATPVITDATAPGELAGSKFGVAGGAGPVHSDEMSPFNAMVRHKIEKAKFYPRWAWKRGFEGVVGVRFLVRPDGEVGEVQVIKPSPYETLNEAAQEAVTKAAPFQPRPKELEGKELAMEIHIAFRLD